MHTLNHLQNPELGAVFPPFFTTNVKEIILSRKIRKKVFMFFVHENMVNYFVIDVDILLLILDSFFISCKK